MIKLMKVTSVSLAFIISLLFYYGCTGKGPSTKATQAANDTVSAVPDTGFTGIKQFMSGKYVVSEVTFKNGVKEGLKKTFYASGKVRQTFWYVNNLREDSSKWYYEEGQVFRSTPYKNDTIDGIQIQYYRTGEVKAKLKYIKGLRAPFLEEYTRDGKLIKGYPELVIKTKDDYKSKGTYEITLELSNKSQKVRYYKGDFSKGVFDTAHCERINAVKGIAYLNFKKTAKPQAGYVGVIAEILTNFGNNLLVYKKIDLPYKDLK
jgi:hypothetical protein